MKIFPSIRTLVFVLFFVSSAGLNVATLASTAVATAMSGMFTVVTGVTSVIGNMSNAINVRDRNLKTAKKLIRKATAKITRRAAKGVSRDLGMMFGEAIPYFGVAAVVGATAWDLKDACATMQEMQELNNALNPDDNIDPDVSKVCGKSVPTKEEVWVFVKNSPEIAWEKAGKEMSKLPDFSDWPILPDMRILPDWLTLSEVMPKSKNGAKTAIESMRGAVETAVENVRDGARKAVDELRD